ncbi:MAG TPA: CDP-alcohol phosphatidyltransferase family protein [Anaerolineales bacterium]|nr:CDP-alcohol phosphatidyltransferase family protein [Anaerolineales bacterium]HNQ93323.1 CDP-alcohol phosphatidyltransferase family protein [Anaerolineales bacterium]HNS60711.1 CDP-alcohol phosphatidyltransferase family protein [Anaerolineales bacterium]
MFERLPLWLRKTLAWSVHLFTATGAVWGFLTLLAIWESNFKLAIVYIVIAMLVDGFDGMLARLFHVKEYAQGVDGGLMDNIIDYLNYVVVAALLLIRVPDLMPEGFAMAAAISILLTSAYQFAQTDAKTDNDSYFFKGFPSVWNFLVVYMMLLGLNPWINLALLVICNILIFLPVKYLYPSRNTRLRRFTLGFTYLYAGLGVWALLQYPEVPKWVAPASFVYVAYYALLSFFPKFGTPKTA